MKKRIKKETLKDIDLTDDFGESDPIVVKCMTMSNNEKGVFDGAKFIEILKKTRADNTKKSELK